MRQSDDVREPAIVKLAGRALRRTARMAYRILPAGVCTRLACSRLGKRLVSRLAPTGLSVYPCDFELRLRLSGEDAISLGVVQLGCVNPFETELLVKHLKPGNVFMDIGCYVDGWHSLVASRLVGPTGHIYAFEPIPDYFAQFKANVELNGVANITLEPLAASDVAGESRFCIDGSNSRIATPDAQPPPTRSVTVRTTTLDDYADAHDISEVHMLKIDVEGAEALVLRGAKRLLRRTVRFLLLEVVEHFLKRHQTSSDELIGQLRAIGFTPYAITRRGLVRFDAGVPESETLNVFFVRDTPPAP